MFKVFFHTNIDAYSDKPYISELPFRPMIGDKVPFYGQIKIGNKLPVLEIISIQYCVTQDFDCFTCFLDFSKNEHPEIMRRVLNHEVEF
jgi:hypothetical protein